MLSESQQRCCSVDQGLPFFLADRILDADPTCQESNPVLPLHISSAAEQLKS